MNAIMQRREFVLGAASFLPLSKMCAAALETPIIRIGVMTDTHVGKTLKSCEHVRWALNLFKDKGADIIVNNGDIADHFYPTGYKAYRQVAREVYGKEYRPQEIFAYAWHDAYDYQGHPRNKVVEDAPQAFEEVRQLLEAPHAHTAEIRFKGYTFLVMPQFTGRKGFLSWKEYEDKVASACKANPGKPVFVVDHVPPSGTVYNSYNWGNHITRSVLNKYPQVVNLSGHVHGSLRNDLFIWQKEFTVINSACLQVWGGLLAANKPEQKREYGVLTVDVHADRLVVRRWDVRDGSEIDPSHPWIVPLPFCANNAPYNRELRKAAEPIPAFPKSATLSVSAEGAPFKGFRLSFPEVSENTMLYRIEAQRKEGKGSWNTFTWLEIFSDYWKHPKDKTGSANFLYKAEYFDPDVEYRFAVSPVNQYGVKGGAILAETRSPNSFPKATTLFECDNPMKEMTLCRRVNHKHIYSETNGFLGPVIDKQTFLMLPEGLFKGKKGTHFRAILDICTKQDEDGLVWSLKFLDPNALIGASERISTSSGESGNCRYVLDLIKGSTSDTYHICFEWGKGGLVKLNHVKIERIDCRKDG